MKAPVGASGLSLCITTRYVFRKALAQFPGEGIRHTQDQEWRRAFNAETSGLKRIVH